MSLNLSKQPCIPKIALELKRLAKNYKSWCQFTKEKNPPNKIKINCILSLISLKLLVTSVAFWATLCKSEQNLVLNLLRFQQSNGNLSLILCDFKDL